MKKLPEYIFFDDKPQQRVLDLVKKWSPDQIAILVDENTKIHCLPLIKLPHASVIEIPSGEKNKTLDTCSLIWQQMTEMGLSRKSLLINLGGGVIGDMGGFVAATYKRGIRFINIPTTLLSQVDASIGGKLGVDFNGLKNHIGIFKDPDAVILSNLFLKTLDHRQLRSGYAEVIKHGLIWDQAYFETTKYDRFPENVKWDMLLKRSIEIKGEVVTADPLEQGLRKILNFGHTLGHAVETYHLESGIDMLHGEAIAIGMMMELHLSYQLGWVNKETLDQVNQHLLHIFGHLSTVPASSVLMELMKHDKKNQSDQINFSLLDKIGSCKFDVQVSAQQIESAVDYYKAFKLDK